jgi:hypothetical protein
MKEGKELSAKLAQNLRRDRESISRRHCERSEAIHRTAQRKNRLLRFARNDGVQSR